MSFSMINPNMMGFYDAGNDFLGFANRWNTAINQGQTRGNAFLANTIKGNELGAQLNDMGSENMLADLQRAEAMLTSGVDQLEERRKGKLLECILSGSQTPECQMLYSTATGQQLTQTQAPQMSMDPALSYDGLSPTIRNALGL